MKRSLVRFMALAIALILLLTSVPVAMSEGYELSPEEIALLTSPAEECSSEDDAALPEADTSDDVAAEPVVDPTVASDEELLPDATPELIIDTTPEPVGELTAEPSVAPSVEPSVAPSVEPAVDGTSVPVAEAEATPAVEPAEDEAEIPAPQTAQELANSIGLSLEELAAELGMSVDELNALSADEIAELYAQGSVMMGGAETMATDMGRFTISGNTLIKYYGSNSDGITKVEIPADMGITTIGNGAFESCGWLKEIIIPEGVTTIGDSAFAGCWSLKEIIIPEGVTTIGDSAFSSCGLTGIVLPDSVKEIGDSVFFFCDDLTSITIPDGVTEIGNAAFSSCSGLTSITIPDGVTEIGNAAFSSCSGLTAITIPDGVKSIGDRVFYRCTGLKSITIPERVTAIGEEAFRDCTDLAEINILGSIDAIGQSFFENCTSLTSVVLPESVKEIGYSAFNGCSKLISVNIPENVRRIDRNAFYNCSSLTSIAIPAGVTVIDYNTFYGCTNLHSVSLPENLTRIGEAAFYKCISLTSLLIPESVYSLGEDAFYGCLDLTATVYEGSYAQTYCKDNFINYALLESPSGGIGSSVFIVKNGVLQKYVEENAGGVTNVVIPADLGITEIGDYAFTDCDTITSVVIPAGVLSIGSYALWDCEKLKTIRIPASVNEIGEYALHWNASIEVSGGSFAHAYCIETDQKYTVFENIPESGFYVRDGVLYDYVNKKSEEIVIPNGLGITAIDDWVFENRGIVSIVLPDGLTSIGRGAFAVNRSLVSVAMPDGLVTIGGNAFECCTKLEKIVVPDSVRSIGSYAFSECTKLKEITLPGSLKAIEQGMFNGCTSLQQITLPDGMESIGGSAFSGCTSLRQIILPDSMESIEGYVFSGCTSLQQIALPDSVKSIGIGLFSNCHNLIRVSLPEELASIGISAFKGCSSLLEVTIPNGVKAIENSTFSGCSEMLRISLPDGLRTIDNGAFKGCSSLTAIDIPDGVLSIGEAAFESCSSLTKAVIPEGITSVEPETFYYCSNLEYVQLPDTIKNIGIRAFDNCQRLQEINIPEGVTHIGQYAFADCNSLTSLVLPKSISSLNSYGGTKNDGVFVSSKNLVLSVYKDSYAYQHCVRCGLNYTIICDHNWQIIEEIKKVSCTEDGEQKRKCSLCNTEETAIIPATGHTEVILPAVSMSCAQNGLTEGKKCSVCGAVLLAQQVIPAVPHTEVVLEAVEPTEKKNGLTEGKKCSVCGTILVKQEIIPALMASFALTKTGSNGTYTLSVGESLRLDPAFADENGWTIRSWKSGSSRRVSVDENGIVEALAEGSATITATCTNNEKATIRIKVADPNKPESIELNCGSSLSLAVGEEFYIEAEVLPETADCALSYKSSKSSVATVDGDGLITGVKKGSATITVKATSESGASQSETIKVNVKKAPTKVELNDSKVALVEGGETFQLKASFGSSSYGSALYWSSSNEDVVTVDESGLLTPVGKGTAIITVETFNGLTDSCTVTVTGAPAELYVEETELVMSYKQTHQINAMLLDDEGNECDGKIRYKSSHSKNVSVSSSGKITIKKSTKGTAEITLTSENGLTETVYVEVVAAPSKVRLEETSIILGVGEEYQIEPILDEDEAASFRYSSSKKTVASVDAHGVVTAVKEGTAKITVRTHNGKKTTLTVTVTATPAVNSVDLNREGTIEVALGSSLQLAATVLPASASSKLTWKSSDASVATVNENGLVIPISTGIATIKVSSENGRWDSVQIHVWDPKVPTGIELAQAEAITLQIGATIQLNAVMTPATAESKLKWESLDKRIATVGADGVVTAVAEGKTQVRVSTENGKEDSVQIIVVDPSTPTGIELSHSDAVTLMAGKTLQLHAKMLPVHAKGDFTWTSTDVSVAKVNDSGLVTGFLTGKATIQVKTYNGFTDEVIVEVVSNPNAPTSVSLGQENVYLKVGENLRLTATVMPPTAEGTLEWSSGTSDVAVVSSDGVVTAVGVGTARVYAKTFNGKSAYCKVIVDEAEEDSGELLKYLGKKIATVNSEVKDQLLVSSGNIYANAYFGCEVDNNKRIITVLLNEKLDASGRYNICGVYPSLAIHTANNKLTANGWKYLISDESYFLYIKDGTYTLKMEYDSGVVTTVMAYYVANADYSSCDLFQFMGKTLTELNKEVDNPVWVSSGDTYANTYYGCEVDTGEHITTLLIMQSQDNTGKYNICGIYPSMTLSSAKSKASADGWEYMIDMSGEMLYMKDKTYVLSIKYSSNKVTQVMVYYTN